jgi:AcrR family transcriptional regulator
VSDKGGRPRATIDAGLVENSAALGCTIEEIAAILGVGKRTLYDRLDSDADLAEALERGRDKGKATLRRLQWQQANAGNPTMLIWLGKQILGQRDRVATEVSGPDGAPVKVEIDDREAARRVAFLLARATQNTQE